MLDHTHAPQDYDELYRHFLPFIRRIVVRAGISSQDVDDVVSSLMLTIIEKDVIGWYDPEYVHDTGDSPQLPGPRYRKPKFSGLLKRVCELYVRQHLDKQYNLVRRESTRLEQPVITLHGDGVSATWADVHAPAHLDNDMPLVLSDVLASTCGRLEATGHMYSSRLGGLYDERRATSAQQALTVLCAAQALHGQHEAETGRSAVHPISVASVSKATGLSPQTAARALTEARSALAASLGTWYTPPPKPVSRPRSLVRVWRHPVHKTEVHVQPGQTVLAHSRVVTSFVVTDHTNTPVWKVDSGGRVTRAPRNTVLSRYTPVFSGHRFKGVVCEPGSG